MTAPATIVLFGVTGDLSKRKLLPALARLAAERRLPSSVRIVGVSRRPNLDKDDLLANVPQSQEIRNQLELFSMDMAHTSEFERLAAHLKTIDGGSDDVQRLYFLSVPPEGNAAIISGLGTSGLSSSPQAKLLIEKPFGVDLDSAHALITQIEGVFPASRIYRVDHYLAKQNARALTAFRTEFPDVEKLWNREHIVRVDIIAAETIDIEGRADFYEQTGALIDFAQNHLLELAALALADLAGAGATAEQARTNAITSLRFDAERSIRGQYEGYRDEAKNPESIRETYVSLFAVSEQARWEGVPIRLTTGKALDKKVSEIRLFFRGQEEHPGLVWPLQDGSRPACDPSLVPSGPLGALVRAVTEWTNAAPGAVPEAYESVFFDALQAKKDSFVSSDEVLASWVALKPLQERWKASGGGLRLYPKGSSPDDIH